jgi:hypothetical protein
MNTVLKVGLTVIGALVIAVGVVYFATPDTVVGPAGKDGKDGIGAVTGPEVFNDTFTVNGVTKFYRQTKMVAATTTLCAMKGPSSTSTLDRAAFIINVGTGTAATIDIGTSTTAFATTTNLSAANSIGSGAQGQAYWSPTGGTANDSMMAPNTYVNVKTAGAGLGGYTYNGTCIAEWTVL